MTLEERIKEIKSKLQKYNDLSQLNVITQKLLVIIQELQQENENLLMSIKTELSTNDANCREIVRLEQLNIKLEFENEKLKEGLGKISNHFNDCSDTHRQAKILKKMAKTYLGQLNKGVEND